MPENKITNGRAETKELEACGEDADQDFGRILAGFWMDTPRYFSWLQGDAGKPISPKGGTKMEKQKLLNAVAESSSGTHYPPKTASVHHQNQPGRERAAKAGRSGSAMKRAVDIVVAFVAAIFFLPLAVIISCVVALDGGPVLFRHTRIGHNGVPFRCLKFRTMVVNADEVLRDLLDRDPKARAEWERDFKLKRDIRITRVGRFLRETSLDELPQIINVLRGEMSLVGPRPIVSAEIERYGHHIEYYYACRPGMTGLWQVSGRNDVSYEERVRLDIRYAKTATIPHDFLIMLKTVGVVFQRSGSY